MSAARERATAVLLIALGGLVVLVAAGRTWVRLRPAAAVALPPVRLSGRALSAGVPALGLLLLAAAAGVLAVRGPARRAVGAVAVLAALLAAELTVAAAYGPHRRATAVSAAGDRLGSPTGATAATSGWPAVALAGAALALAGGAWALARSGRWSSLGRRYDSPARPSGQDVDAWQALSRGDDPTL
ncbi:putative membrane protein (TIGR02234 family) [Motilibacter rhizosphaerae]|uniref:Putative membrane protein (TIGR02234 family) n=1 Tax=Motilibacter rhizosphaerae TaxID=598652 RepID=A0A4Q7NG40_9ACTN|nr:Trp biosynthesis-associated membrane protein [Motilibacter rhizosphaerae]RZS82880.1 putative membrane protein (TIGR02234 family) [Motilibacter rhizosphaerae]